MGICAGGSSSNAYYPFYRTAAATAEEDNAVTDEKMTDRPTGN
jgi:hypothetical protein